MKENTIKTEKCEVIVLMEKVTGRMEITNKHIYFFLDHTQQDKKDLLQCECHAHPSSHVIVM